MGIEKDLLLILLFLFLIVFKYLRLKKDFIAQRNYFIQTLSHDLRVSTIAQIRGLEVVQKDNTLKDSQKEMLSYVNDSCQFTLDMINMLLNTYKFERKEPVLNYEYSNIAEIISKSCNLVSCQSEEKGIKIVDSLANSFLNFDKNYISKVINILLSTAIFYSNKNSVIKVLNKELFKEVEVSVLYNGNILTDEELKRMFSKNPRFSTVGHGIKMHLCKKIIDFHKGKISVKRVNKNLVAFTFKIPIKACKNSTVGAKIQSQKMLYSLSK